MGGQACVFHGAAPFSKDVDLALLAEGHYHATGTELTPERIRFWLAEARGPERLVELARRFPAEARALTGTRPLLVHAIEGDLAALRPALSGRPLPAPHTPRPPRHRHENLATPASPKGLFGTPGRGRPHFPPQPAP